ncbi:Putative ribonuclease H protein At1g65750 [Linum perenne]
MEELGNDTPVWGFEPNGRYSVRSGYLLAKDIVGGGGNDIWQIAWKWEGPHRIRHFLWTAIHGRLLTNSETVRHYLTGTRECSFCNSSPETIEHLFRCCQITRQVWGKVSSISGSDPFFSMPMDVWWRSNIADSKRALIFGNTVWILWESRNEEVFEGKSSPVDSIVERIKFWVSAANSAAIELNSIKCGLSRNKVINQISWEAAPDPKATLNTDGLVQSNTGESAAGGVIRDSNCRVIDVFAANLGVCSISRAEMTAIIIGMERARSAGIWDLEIQTDSTCAIHLLTEEGNRDHQHAAVVRKYRHLVERNWRVNVKHIYREANHLADALANKGHTLELGTHSMERTDRSVIYWETYDSVGGAEPRRIVT